MTPQLIDGGYVFRQLKMLAELTEEIYNSAHQLFVIVSAIFRKNKNERNFKKRFYLSNRFQTHFLVNIGRLFFISLKKN